MKTNARMSHSAVEIPVGMQDAFLETTATDQFFVALVGRPSAPMELVRPLRSSGLGLWRGQEQGSPIWKFTVQETGHASGGYGRTRVHELRDVEQRDASPEMDPVFTVGGRPRTGPSRSKDLKRNCFMSAGQFGSTLDRYVDATQGSGFND